MIDTIYLDNAATTRMKSEVISAMPDWLFVNYGNPSSNHKLGIAARQAIEKARKIVADSINAEPSEIIFTSGGSEANNLAINGCKRNCLTSTSAIEHHSILNQRYYYQIIPVDENGIVNIANLTSYVAPGIVSIMAANNEIGTIEPIKLIGEIIDHNTTIFHVDAVQMYPHMKIDVKDLQIDAMSVSGHKFGAPKGTGFLYIRKEIQKEFQPLIYGGGQERGLRSGTENVPGIVGLGKAVEVLQENMEQNNAFVTAYRNLLYEQITKHIPEAKLNGTSNWNKRLCSNLNFRFEGVPGERLLEWLNEHDIYASSGSACNSNTGEVSHVLKAIGLTDKEASESIRFTFSEENELEEVGYVVDVLKEGIKLLKED